MDFMLALKSFFKALKDVKGAKQFLEGKQPDAHAEGGNSHLRLLALLQREGRLIDFFKEDVSQFTDAQIGAAMRIIHRECNKALEEFVALRPLFQEAEGASVSLAQGYDVHAIKVIGKVKGAPPYQGILRHKGWKAHKLSLPKQILQADQSVVCPAEVEVKE
jgi:Domain of unknown function (DUF2760)